MRGTRKRSIRVSDELWARAQARATAAGTDVSAVLREALQTYIAAADQANPSPIRQGAHPADPLVGRHSRIVREATIASALDRPRSSRVVRGGRE